MRRQSRCALGVPAPCCPVPAGRACLWAAAAAAAAWLPAFGFGLLLAGEGRCRQAGCVRCTAMEHPCSSRLGRAQHPVCCGQTSPPHPLLQPAHVLPSTGAGDGGSGSGVERRPVWLPRVLHQERDRHCGWGAARAGGCSIEGAGWWVLAGRHTAGQCWQHCPAELQALLPPSARLTAPSLHTSFPFYPCTGGVPRKPAQGGGCAAGGGAASHRVHCGQAVQRAVVLLMADALDPVKCELRCGVMQGWFRLPGALCGSGGCCRQQPWCMPAAGQFHASKSCRKHAAEGSVALPLWQALGSASWNSSRSRQAGTAAGTAGERAPERMTHRTANCIPTMLQVVQ